MLLETNLALAEESKGSEDVRKTIIPQIKVKKEALEKVERIVLRYKNGEEFIGLKRKNDKKDGLYSKDEFLYECEICGKRVGKQINLRIHCRKHSLAL
ncbi:MAG: hypothetical protein GY714_33010, partial [Desulfobacterales bacterium]|nr:hypothetical protein [Desulfobacterales bacterium]